MSPLLSIVIPLYNKQDLILRTLRCVMAQDNDNYEIVVVDDGSTDKSVQKVESLADKRIRLFRKENGGPASARNIGVKNAQGKWILFLDADDTLEENALQIVFSDIKNHRFADVFCYCQYMLQNDVKRIFPKKHAKGYVVFLLEMVLRTLVSGTWQNGCKKRVYATGALQRRPETMGRR